MQLICYGHKTNMGCFPKCQANVQPNEEEKYIHADRNEEKELKHLSPSKDHEDSEDTSADENSSDFDEGWDSGHYLSYDEDTLAGKYTFSSGFVTSNTTSSTEHQANIVLSEKPVTKYRRMHEPLHSSSFEINIGNHDCNVGDTEIFEDISIGNDNNGQGNLSTVENKSSSEPCYTYYVKEKNNCMGTHFANRGEDSEERQAHVELLTRIVSDETTIIRTPVPKKVVCITEDNDFQQIFVHSKNPDYMRNQKPLWLQPLSEGGDEISEKKLIRNHDNEDTSLIKTTLDRCLTFQYQPRICENINVYLCQGSIGDFDAMHLQIKDVEELNRNFKYEWIRYSSFQKYSTKFNMYPSVLAREGWWYSDGTEGMTDKVTCFECRKSHQDWNRGEDARQHHADSCRFLRGTSSNVPIYNRNLSMTQAAFASTSTNNSRSAISQTASGGEGDVFPSQESLALPVPVQQTDDNTQVEASASQNSDRLCNNGSIGTSQDSHGTVPAQSEDINTSRNQLETSERSNEANNSNTAVSFSENNPTQTLASSVETNAPRPKYPAYELMETRTKSFQGWPTGKTQTPRELALAGLFFAGYEDYVRCHSCGIGLRNWDDGDDPWVEHARWSPNCDYVIRSRGKRFVDLIQRKAKEKESERSESAGSRQAKANSALEKEMQSETVKSIRDMGYSDDAITSALTTLKRRLGPGKHKVTAQDVLDIILEQSQEDTTGGNVHSALAATSTSVGDHTKFDKTESVSKQSKPSKERNVSNPECGIRTMQDDHRDLTEQLTCKICMERSVAMTFIPCGHLACCEECSRKIMRCPICRTRIKSKYKTYFT